MGRPVLQICTRCEVSRADRKSGATPEALYDGVKALRRERTLKELFKVERTDCLGLCNGPCAVELSGSRRSTYRRSGVRSPGDAEALVRMACAYAALPAGGELPERGLPGDHED